MYKVSNFSVRGKILADLGILTLSSIIVESNLVAEGQKVFSATNLLLLAICITCWLFSSRALGLYSDFRAKPFSVEWVVFLKTLVLYTLLFSFILVQFFNHEPYNRPRLLFNVSMIFVLLPVQKLVMRIVAKRLRNSQKILRKVLIVGAGNTGMDFYRRYVKDRHYGYELAGFVDDEKRPALNGHYLGTTSDIDKVIASYELDDIIVTLPMTNETQIKKIVSVGEKEGKRIRIIPNYAGYSYGKLQVDSLGSLSIITLRSLPLDALDNKAYKRFFDIVFSSLVIILLFSWLFPIIGILIKLSSKGPIFFKQERWGLNNKTITCFKFRSMVACSKDVDENGRYLQASKDDPRVTPIGRFLRKTNLDELPQFFHVLLGSMSVVGPRPHPVPLNIESKGSVQNYMMRHWVKPGITGWAQVHGYRGETKESFLMKKRVKYDLWYIEHWTFWLDLQIILQTLVNMVKGEENAF